MPIYTKTGDKGKTALFGGKRVLKCNELVEAYGSIDELNSWIGLISAEIGSDETVVAFLVQIRADLFTIGGHLAGWKGELKDLAKRVKKMEQLIDEMDQELPELHNFVITTGTRAAAVSQLARAVCRRTEREIVKLAQTEDVDARILTYVNRLSDLLFVLGRFINRKTGGTETIWSGIQNNKDSVE